MYRNEDCKCGEVHQCAKCLPEEAAVELARRVGLTFILVMLHKGHYTKSIETGEHFGGSGPPVRELWHALVDLDRQHL